MSEHPQRPRILLVDDDGAVREHLARALSDEFVIDTANDGVDALRTLLRIRPDVIATDVVMPVLDGIEFLKTLRGTPSMRLIPVLLISGKAAENLRVEGFEQGADGYLPKPYTERELRARLRSMIQIARERAEASRLAALEQAQQEAIAERAALLESITDPFYALDRELRFTYINKRALDYYARPPEQLLGKKLFDLYPQSRGSVFETNYLRALRQHQPVDFEAVSPISKLWLEVHVYPTERGLAINFRDITARKEVERALFESEAARDASEQRQRVAARRDAVRVLLADTLRLLRDLPAIGAAATQILGEYLNASRVLFLDFSEESERARVQGSHVVLDSRLADAYRLDDFGPLGSEAARLGTTQAVDSVAPAVEPHQLETCRLDDGALVLAPVMQGGRMAAAVWVQHLSPRQWTPEEIALIEEFAERTWIALEQARHQAEMLSTNRRKDEFLATLAHELRNPLAPLRSAAHLLKQPQLSEEQLRYSREVIDRQTNHMVRLVDDLLDVTRINLGQVHLHDELISLNTLIADSVESAQPALDEGHHTLEIQTPEHAVWLQGDATRLVQVIQNLLSNAAKYTPPGGHIQLSATVADSEVSIRVRDDGLGIASEAQGRIFELFTRVDPRGSVKVAGLGIGLAIARRLVELHNGRIDVSSEGAGKGSEFTVVLPTVTGAEEPTIATPDKPAPTVEGRHVLIVDDNRDAAEALALLLKLEGFATLVAFDGQTALEAVERSPPDVVLLDIGMPIMDGYEVARRIRAIPAGADIVLVALTGWGQAKDRQQAFAAGFDEHLTKPADPDKLGRILNETHRRSGNGDAR